MRRHLLPTALLLSTLGAFGSDYRTTPESRGRVTAWLDVTIGKSQEPGLAEVMVVVSVEGPTGLQVKEATVGDAVSAWKWTMQKPARRDGNPVVWTQAIMLTQGKPGQVPLPAVKVSFRASSDSAWETVEWADPLPRRVQGLPSPVELPEPPSVARRWRGTAALTLSLASVLVMVSALMWLRRQRPKAMLTPEVRAAGISPPPPPCRTWPPRIERMADVVRGYYAEHCKLPAPRQTTTEFMEAVSRNSTVSDERRERLREFFERCDLVKFAGVRPTLEERRRTAEVARELVSFSRERSASADRAFGER